MAPLYLSNCITMYTEIAVMGARASNLVVVPDAPLAVFDNSFRIEAL